jgi:RNA polymerase sigma-70 factor (ECF subfamily)
LEKSDAQLAEDAARGDAPAFGALVERFRSPVIGHLIGMLETRDDAEELAQEAFLKAWQKLPSLASPEAFGAWLHRIAHNLALGHVRRPRSVPLPSDVPERGCDDPGGQKPEDNKYLPLLAAVSRLSEPHREVIARKHFGGYSGEQIALQLGISAGTVRSRLSRAYDELRGMLASDEES